MTYSKIAVRYKAAGATRVAFGGVASLTLLPSRSIRRASACGSSSESPRVEYA